MVIANTRTGLSSDRPLLISSCLILAICTAKWAGSHDEKLSNHELDKEIDYSIHLADSRPVQAPRQKEHTSSLGESASPGISQTTRTYRNDGQSKRADPLSSPRPPLSDFSKTCFGEQTAAMPFRNHSGIAGKPALPPFSRCHIRCKSFLIASPSLVAKPPDGLCRLSSLEDCSSVSKNNSTDELPVNAALTLHILWK